MTVDEISAMFAPKRETIEGVLNWLTESGISKQRIHLAWNRGWVTFNASINEIEDLLHAEYHTYTHVVDKRTALSTHE